MVTVCMYVIYMNDGTVALKPIASGRYHIEGKIK